VCDALLGAAALGDIGTSFSNTDPKWKGANSLMFLEHARKLLTKSLLTIEHVICVVITEGQNGAAFSEKLREALAKSSAGTEQIHLKAKNQ